MYKGQPINLQLLLPEWLSVDDFYIMGSAFAAFLSVVAVGMSFIERDDRKARVKGLQERRQQLRGELTGTKRRSKRGKPEQSVNWMRKVVMRFQLLKNSGVKQIGEKLVQAGWRSKDALIIFAFFSLVTPIVFGIAGISLMGLDWGTGKMAKLKFASPLFLLYVGFKLPSWVVERRRKKRNAKIQRALADTLDLMTICAEAGLSLSASLERVSRELGIAYPEMAEELSLTSMEIGFLPDRSKALLNLSERVGLPEVRGIVNVLNQTEKYGTPIAQALRVLSAEFREQRMLRAENKAARLPAIMTLPMIVFILPTMFIIIIAPSAIRVSDTWK